MSPPCEFASFAAAYPTVVSEAVNGGAIVDGVVDSSSVGSDFGSTDRSTRELIAHGFALNDPTDVLVHSPGRPIDVVYALGNLLWTLSGSNDGASIAYYNAQAQKFEDESGLMPSAIGPRIVAPDGSGQLSTVVETLRLDPTTRRAQIVFARAADVAERKRDDPCPCALQFLLRQGRLNAICTMRSQSALMVLPYDVFLMTALQRLVASELGVDTGRYFHLSGSLHIYEDEVERAAALLDGGCRSVRVLPIQHPRGSPTEVLRLESALRAAALSGDVDLVTAETYGLRAPVDFWSEALALLAYKAATVVGSSKIEHEMQSLLRRDVRQLLDLRSDSDRLRYLPPVG